jgi:hypothetical protein
MKRTKRNKGKGEAGNKKVEKVRERKTGMQGRRLLIPLYKQASVWNDSQSWTVRRTSRHTLYTEESDTAFRMKTLNSVSLQLHGVSGE